METVFPEISILQMQNIVISSFIRLIRNFFALFKKRASAAVGVAGGVTAFILPFVFAGE